MLALCSSTAERSVFCLHNLGDRRREVHVDLGLSEGDQVTEIFADGEYPPATNGRVTLAPFGYRWLRVARVARG